MKKRDTNVLSLLEDKTNDYARKTALGMKTTFGWRELTYDGVGENLHMTGLGLWLEGLLHI